jgi:hypothetical protein
MSADRGAGDGSIQQISIKLPQAVAAVAEVVVVREQPDKDAQTLGVNVALTIPDYVEK